MLIPVISFRDGGVWNGAVQLDDVLAGVRSLSYTGLVTLVLDEAAIASGPKDAAMGPVLRSAQCCVGPIPVDGAVAVSWLDCGADVVYFELKTLGEADVAPVYELATQFPNERMAIKVVYPLGGSAEELATFNETLKNIAEIVGTVFITIAAPLALAVGDAPAPPTDDAKSVSETKLQQLVDACKSTSLVLDAQTGTGSLIDAPQVGVLHQKWKYTHVQALGFVGEEGKCPASHVDIAAAFLGCLRTDRADGLFTTVVADETGKAMGLVYSNAESIRAAFVCGRGVYWSRSRNGLWRKGDTSGAWQELWGLSIDCDSDALLFTVHQHGAPPAFCHLGSYTCWGKAQQLGGIRDLEQTLTARKANAPEGSYTKRLFDDPKLLRKKLLEEAQELIEAETPDHVAAEAADVIYFAMTRVVAAGATLNDIERHLDARSLKVTRRPGNAKPYGHKHFTE